MKILEFHRWMSGTLAVLALLATTVAAEIVRLKDGSLVHGDIVEFDEATGLVLQRVDNGGRLALRWEHLPPAEVKRIKASRGFTGEDPQPYMVNVVHLVLRNGTTESGVLENDGGGDDFVLRRRGSTDRIPRSRVASVETGRMEGLAVYQPDELYRVLLDEYGTPVDALSHFNLAVVCQGAGLYVPAREHYLAVQAADPKFKRDLIETRLARVEIKIEDAAETAVLDEIRNRLYRKQFDVAADMANSFRAEYPTSRQMGDLLALEKEINQRKTDSVSRSIVTDYFSMLDKRIAKIARDEEATLDIAQELVESSIHDDIIESLAGRYTMPASTVQELWEARSGGSVRSFSYGTGTFILGKDKALEFGRFDDEEDAAAADGPEVQDDDDFSDIVEKVKRQRQLRAAERQSSVRRATADDDAISPEEWWSSAPTDERIRWLTAYYAEFSSQLRVIEARGRPCRHCDAVGYIDGINERGENERRPCPVCMNLKFERLVRYR